RASFIMGASCGQKNRDVQYRWRPGCNQRTFVPRDPQFTGPTALLANRTVVDSLRESMARSCHASWHSVNARSELTTVDRVSYGRASWLRKRDTTTAQAFLTEPGGRRGIAVRRGTCPAWARA